MEIDVDKRRNYYQLQTKLYHVEDTLVTLGPFGLTLRQCFVLVLGGCGSIDVWRLLDGRILLGSAGMVIQLSLASVPLLLSALVAVVRIADRYSEAWMIVLVRYLRCSNIYLWRPQPHDTTPAKSGRKTHDQREEKDNNEYDTKEA